MIREYKPEDVDEVIDLWKKASEIAHPFLTREFLELEANMMRYFGLPESETYVYIKDEKVDGFIAMITNDVGALFVDPLMQRRGIGRKLLDFVSETREYMTVDVFKENVIGLPFYIKYGFEIVDEFPHQDTGNMVYRMRYKPRG